MQLLILVVRYLFLALFFAFLFKLAYYILQDARKKTQPESVVQPCTGAELVVISSTDRGLPPGTRITLYNNTLLGRADNSDVKILDHFVSSRHALITCQASQYWLEDLGSLNGTYLNETKLSSTTAIADGDMIRVGGVSFQFVRWAYEVGTDNRSGISQAE